LFLYITAKLTVSTPHGKARYVAWFIETRFILQTSLFGRNIEERHPVGRRKVSDVRINGNWMCPTPGRIRACQHNVRLFSEPQLLTC